MHRADRNQDQAGDLVWMAAGIQHADLAAERMAEQIEGRAGKPCLHGSDGLRPILGQHLVIPEIVVARRLASAALLMAAQFGDGDMMAGLAQGMGQRHVIAGFHAHRRLDQDGGCSSIGGWINLQREAGPLLTLEAEGFGSCSRHRHGVIKP